MMALPQEQSAKRQEMEYKRIEREMKNKEREIKQREKMNKRLEKQHKRWEKQKKKYEKKGLPVPPEPKMELEPEKPTPTTVPAKEIDLPEAEIITAEADVWTPKSARNLDEIQKRIDRMDKKHIKNLRERYKERYGEDLEVPDIYNVSTSLEVETAEETGELKVSEMTSTGLSVSAAASGLDAKEEPKKGGLIFGRSGSKEKDKGLGLGTTKKKDRVKIDHPARFLDLRKPLFLKSKFINEESSGGTKAILTLIDIIILIICIIVFPIIIIRIIGTFFYIRRDKLEQEIVESKKEEIGTPQPTT